MEPAENGTGKLIFIGWPQQTHGAPLGLRELLDTDQPRQR
jgi:hypothetical protein